MSCGASVEVVWVVDARPGAGVWWDTDTSHRKAVVMTTATRNQQRPDVNEMIVTHRLFRREFVAIPQLSRRVPDRDTNRVSTG
jgi:hypothetical protein